MSRRMILWLAVVPIVVFAILMFPEHSFKIFGVELASPIPPFP